MCNVMHFAHARSVSLWVHDKLLNFCSHNFSESEKTYAEGFNVSRWRLELMNPHAGFSPLHCVKNRCFIRDLAKTDAIERRSQTIHSFNILAHSWIKSHQWGAVRARTDLHTSPSKVLPQKTELRLRVYSLHFPVVNHSNVLPSFHFKPQRRKESFRDHIEVRRMKPKKGKKKGKRS